MQMPIIQTGHWTAVCTGILAFFPVGCGRDGATNSPPVSDTSLTALILEDEASKRGLTFRHTPDGAVNQFFPAIMAGGAAMLDLDQDGDLDVLLIDSTRRMESSNQAATRAQGVKLYLQEPDGTFSDAGPASGLNISGFANGCTAGDINNDGLVDLYVTVFGSDQLFLNRGQGKFQEITESSGIVNERWGTSAAVLDFDRDGWLDLFVANYVEYDPGHECVDHGGQKDFCNPAVFPRTSDKLFRNLTGEGPPGSAVRFRDVSLESGIASVQGAGLGVVTADFNDDGWIDIYVANDGHGNFLWINQKNGTFQEEAVLQGIAYDAAGHGQGSMGVACGDINADARPDMVVTSLDGESNAMYVSAQHGYTDASHHLGISDASFGMTGFGTVLFDAENDGDLDLAVINGRVRRRPETNKALRREQSPGRNSSVNDIDQFWEGYAELGKIWRRSDQAFIEETGSSDEFVRLAGVGRGLCQGDVNNDGKVDVLATYLDQPVAVFINQTITAGHWLSVRLTEPSLGGRDAIGASAVVTAGQKEQRRWLFGGGSYQCASDLRLHFGLGTQRHYDAIRVQWPNGDHETFPGGDADQFLVLNHGEGQPL